MKNIAFLAPNKEKLQEISTLLDNYQDEIIFEVGSLADGQAKVKQLIERGIEIILARGETAFNIRDAYPNLVVVDVPISGFDLVLTLEKARQFGDNIAVVSFPSMIKQIECLESALGVRIKKYNLLSREHVNDAIDNALQDGANVIIGGFTATVAARKRNLPCVEIITGSQAYIDSFNNAKSLLKTIIQEKRKAGLITAVLNHAYEGILSIDEKSIITAVNPVAQRILKLPEDSICRKINDVWPEVKLDEIVRTGQEELNQFYTVNGVQVLCNKVAIKDRMGIIGAVATFQDITKIQKMESRIRKEIYAKGHFATYSFKDVHSSDSLLKNVVEMAKSFSVTDANVLVTGETGTGKEVFAQSIHNYSKRVKGPFVAVNCAALPAQLLESELFGYVSGAFTGANKEGKPGLFEVAHAGTIFLDEIGEMDYINQGRLLRVLQERVVVRLGSDRVIPISVRVIAATNKNLQELVANGKFREDLYYRLNVLNLDIPPLRKRKRDIGPYAKIFLAELSKENDRKLKLSIGAIKLLESYGWPGNIRELRNVMERVVAIAKREVVSATFLSELLVTKNWAMEEDEVDNEEVKTITNALNTCNGGIAEAAEMLQINRTTLWRKMSKLGLKK